MQQPTSMQEHLTGGVSISDLALIFRKDRRTVSQRLRNCKPSGERRGHPVYDLADACRCLTLPFDVEAYLLTAEPGDVPPRLFKEFWDGQVARQKFETMEADLWPTPDVKAMFTDVFEKLDTGIRAFAGNIDAHTDLTGKQRKLLGELSAGLLVEARRTLIEGRDIDERIKPRRGALAFVDDGLD